MSRWTSCTPWTGLPPAADDDVAEVEAGLRGRAARHHLQQAQAPALAEPVARPCGGSGAGAPATPSQARRTRPVEISSEMIDRVVVLIGTARPSPMPGDRGVDADHPAGRVGQRAAGVARVEGGVGLDDVVDEAGAPAVADRQRPAERADDAGGHRAGQAERVADRDDELADAQPVGVAEGGRRRPPSRTRSTARSASGIGADHVEPALGAVGELGDAGRAAPATTWALVSMNPSSVKATPEPAPSPRLRAHGEAGDARQQLRRRQWRRPGE